MALTVRDITLLGTGLGLGAIAYKLWTATATARRSSKKFKLIYHSKLGFRSAPIQMLLLDADAEFEMVDPHWGADRVIEKNPGMPSFAPPALRDGDFTVAQTPAILIYLGDQLGYGAGDDDWERAELLQLILDIGDATSELFTEVRKGPDEKAKFATAEEGGRLKNWLLHLRKVFYRRSNAQGFLFHAHRPTAADFFMLATLESIDFSYGTEHISALMPTEFKAWRALMEARPSYSAYKTQAKPILFESMKFSG